MLIFYFDNSIRYLNDVVLFADYIVPTLERGNNPIRVRGAHTG